MNHTVDFKAVRLDYASYAQRGIERYRRERRYVLQNIRSNHHLGVRKSLYYQNALAGLRFLGLD